MTMNKIFFAGWISLLLSACGSGAGKTAQSNAKAGESANASIDTAKLSSDMAALLSGMTTGQMDTVAWQKVAADLNLTPQQLLTDRGLDSSYVNSKDPSMQAAAAQLKKLRDATGWTPSMMDSLKQAADALKAR
jgi:hypothetical protein